MSQYQIYNQNNGLAPLTEQAGPRVTKAIENAAAKTGVDFAYLLHQANTESSFNPNAKARSSSAKGLYQFIDSTWLQMVRDHGDNHGLGHYADMIDARGRVKDPQIKKQILGLRTNPEKSALFAAEYASDNQKYLKRVLGKEKDIGSTELYLAHFMGPGGAAGFLKAHDRSPNAAAAYIFPREARANPNIFYEGNSGRARSLEEIYQNFKNKIDTQPETSKTPTETLVASAPITSIESEPLPALNLKPQKEFRLEKQDKSFALSGSTHIDAEDFNNYVFKNILAAREASDLKLPTYRIKTEERFSELSDSERKLSRNEILLFAQSQNYN